MYYAIDIQNSNCYKIQDKNFEIISIVYYNDFPNFVMKILIYFKLVHLNIMDINVVWKYNYNLVRPEFLLHFFENHSI